jgi:predicted permease
MHSILADIRYAIRQLRGSPGFAATAILTLALGIGATNAIFTLVYQVMLRSLPVSHPEQLYKLGKGIECCVDEGLENDWRVFSYDFYQYFRDHTQGTAGIAAVQAGQTPVSVRRAGDNAAAQPLDARFVSGNYFSVLGVRPYAGRLLREDDDRESAGPTAVLSYTLWRDKFAADPRIVGSTLLVTGHPVTVAGIAAPNFLGERNAEDPPGVWLPLAQEPTFDPDRKLRQFPSEHWLDVLIREPDPSRVPEVQLEVQAEFHQRIAAHREDFKESSDKDVASQTTELAPASDGINDLRDEYEKSLRLLLLVTGFVLLIACANLANLMLVRGMARKQELSVRSALGAPRGRLVRQMMVESLLLSLLGGVAALAVAYAGTRGILALALRGVEFSPLDASPSLPHTLYQTSSFQPVVLIVVALTLLLAALVAALIPARRAATIDPVTALRTE